MEFITNAQENALNERASLWANEKAKRKGKFPKRHFAPKDIAKMLKNQKRIRHTMLSVLRAARVIKQHDATQPYKTKITAEEFAVLNTYITDTLGMDSWGACTFAAHEIFEGDGIPYPNVLVMSRHMEPDTFVVKELPNMDCMLEVMKVYGDTLFYRADFQCEQKNNRTYSKQTGIHWSSFL